MLKRFLPIVLVLALCVSLAACASLQEKWNALTPDEKARVVINDLQTQLTTLFDKGKAYVDTHPEALPIWKEKVVPAFDTANKALRAVIELGMAEEITPDLVYQKVDPLIAEVVNLLVTLGAIKG